MSRPRNVSVMFEVSEDVYTNLVEPFKKNKMLGKLMASLLKGYLEEDEIRGYIDQEIEGMHKASVDVVSSLFENMQESLASMGIYTAEAQSTSESGRKFFKDKQEDFAKGNPEVKQEEITKMQKDIDGIKSQVSEIKELILSLSKGGVSFSKVEPEEEHSTNPVVKKDEPTEEDKKAAKNIMSSILSGNMMEL